MIAESLQSNSPSSMARIGTKYASLNSLVGRKAEPGERLSRSLTTEFAYEAAEPYKLLEPDEHLGGVGMRGDLAERLKRGLLQEP